MDRKKYLLSLVKDRHDLGKSRDIILSNIDKFDDETVEKLIETAETAQKRRDMIKEGKGNEVIKQVKESKAKRRKENLSEAIKDEANEKTLENDQMSSLLSQLDDID